MTPAAFRNALTVLQAIGGSTNGLIHFTAIAGRLGIDLDLEAFDRLGREVPGAGRSEAVGRALHGAFPLGRRRAAAAAPNWRRCWIPPR